MIVLTTLLACGDSPPPEPPSAAPEPAPTAATTPKAEPKSTIERRGKVLEVQETGGYTYARLDYCGQEAWVAGPKSELPVGKIVKMPEGTVVTNFPSPALGTTLDALLMVDWFEITDETSIDCPKIASAPPMIQKRKEKAPPQFHGLVKEAIKSGGYSYIRLETCGEERWLAGRPSVARVGHFVTAKEGAEMKDFPAKSLDRIFPSLWFVPSFKIVAEGPECE